MLSNQLLGLNIKEQTLDHNLTVVAVLDIIKNIKRGITQKPIIEVAALELKFHGRQSLAKKLYAYVKERRFKKIQGTLKGDTIVAQLAGLPGMGKTRINVETYNMIKEENKNDTTEIGTQLKEYLNRSVFIPLSYNNDTMPLDSEINLNTTAHMLWVRVLFYHLNPPEKLQEFSKRFLDGILTASVVVEVIVRLEKVKWVHIGIDEYNQLVDSTKEGRERLKRLVLSVKSAMGMTVENEHILVTCLFTGTVRADATDLWEGSFGDCERLECPQLSAEAIFSILRDRQTDIEAIMKNDKQANKDESSMYKPVGQVSLLSPSVIRACMLVGTVPRVLEIIIMEVLPSVHGIDNIITTAVERAISRYTLGRLRQSIGTVEGCIKLLTHTILRIPVDQAYKIGTKNVQELESSGFLILRAASLANYFIELPYVWLKVIGELLNNNKPEWKVTHILKQLFMDMELSCSDNMVANPWQHFEVLCVQFRYLVLQLLHYMHMPITVRNLWREAKYITDTPDQVLIPNFNVESLSYMLLQQEYPLSKQQLPDSFICRNADKAHAGDCIIKVSNVIIDEQHRHTTDPKADSMTKAMFDQDLENRMPSIDIFKEKNLKYQGIAYISNLRMSTEKFIPTESDFKHKYHVLAIVDRTHLKQHFGESIATYLDSLGLFIFEFYSHFVGRVPINYATEEVLRKVPGIGNVTANKIILQRKIKLFEDQESIRKVFTNPKDFNTAMQVLLF